MPRKSTKNTSQTQLSLEILPKLTQANSEKLTSLLLVSLAKIYQSLEEEKALAAAEVVYSLRRYGLFKNVAPIFLSLKMSRGFSQATTEKTLKSFCERLPTLGYMSANGNCLILPGFYPKIESGYTLSDILEKEVDKKYFLSEEAVRKLQEYSKRMKNTELVEGIY